MRRVRQNLSWQGRQFFRITLHLENLAQVYRVNYLYIIYVIYICVWDRGQGTRSHHRVCWPYHTPKNMAHRHRCSEENARKYERNDDTHLYCTSLQAVVQLHATNAASMKAQWARTAHALHTQRFCAAHACGVKRDTNNKQTQGD